jgi:hypothetical protein
MPLSFCSLVLQMLMALSMPTGSQAVARDQLNPACSSSKSHLLVYGLPPDHEYFRAMGPWFPAKKTFDGDLQYSRFSAQGMIFMFFRDGVWEISPDPGTVGQASVGQAWFTSTSSNKKWLPWTDHVSHWVDHYNSDLQKSKVTIEIGFKCTTTSSCRAGQVGLLTHGTCKLCPSVRRRLSSFAIHLTCVVL